MEISKLTEARRNLEKMRNLMQDLQRSIDSVSREMERNVRELSRLNEETNRCLNDVESEIRRIEKR